MSLASVLEDRELLGNFVLRELRTRYRRSALGWLWSMVNPLALAIVYTIVFSGFLGVKAAPGHPSGLDSFGIFMLVGLLVWSYFANGVTYSISSLEQAAGLITKVYFPRELLVIAPVVSLLANLAAEFGVLLIVEAAMGYNAIATIPFTLVVIAMLCLFTLGWAMILSALSIRYRDIAHLVTVALTFWFFLTPVVYSPDQWPVSWTVGGRSIPVADILGVLPMARFVEAFRSCFFDITAPTPSTLILITFWSLVSFVGGYAFFERRARYFAEEI